MSAAKHTPGPWRRGSDELASPELFSEVYAANGYLIGRCNAGTSRGKEGREEADAARANARLIAAAPEGLQAAENTVAYYAAVEPDTVCLVDNLNPCGGLKHWGGGIGCPLCSARSFLATATGSAS